MENKVKLDQALIVADEKAEMLDQFLENKIDFIDKEYAGKDRKGEIKWKTLITENNFQQVLDKHDIKIELDSITKEIRMNKFEELSADDKALKIKDICHKEGLKINRNDLCDYIKMIANQNKFNEFIELAKKHRNNNYEIIDQVFKTLKIRYDDDSPFTEDLDNYYYEAFRKFCIGVVRMANNTPANNYQSEGILVLQGAQGKYKSTWCSKLMPNKKMFIGGQKLEPSNKDSVIQLTRYILVEIGELDDTVTKKETTALKRFLTQTTDEYRVPYGRNAEKIPRVTSFIGTVNNKNFLRDTTGNRRYMIIPITSCDFKELEKIDICEFWGAIFDLYMNGEQHYLSDKSKAIQESENLKYMAESDVSLMLTEAIDWEAPWESYKCYTLKEICDNLGIKTTGNTKKIKAELEKRNYVYKNYKLPTGQVKTGFKIPPFKNV